MAQSWHRTDQNKEEIATRSLTNNASYKGTRRVNGLQFPFPPRDANGPSACFITHMFDMRCRGSSTSSPRSSPNGQVEHMNRTIKEATVKRFHNNHLQFNKYLVDFVSACNNGRRLKTLRALTPYQYICKPWTPKPERFSLNPFQQMPRLKT
jgi:hypothetical protein